MFAAPRRTVPALALRALALLTVLAAVGCRSRDTAARALDDSGTPRVLTAAGGASTYVAPGATITTNGEGNARIVSEHGSVESTADGVMVTSVPGSGSIERMVSVTADGLRRTFACDSGAIAVLGNKNVLTVTGKCQMINVLGNDNTLTVGASEVIQATGNDNAIHYTAGISKPEPIISNRGSNNTIARGAP